MKILIADKLSPETALSLKNLGIQIDVQPDLSADDLPRAISDTNILVVRSTRVTADAIEAAPQLSLIVRAGAGVNTIDLSTASARGIYVAACPGKNTAAVAELTIGLLIAADRQIVDATIALRNGRWQKKRFSDARGLQGRTLGVLGLGAIGRAVAQRAATGLAMNVVAWSRSLTPDTAKQFDVGFVETPQQLASQSDAVTIHLALCDETRHFVGKEFLKAMRPGAILVNTSRGEVVDLAALKTAVDQQQLRVALDVFDNEPAGGDAEFADAELAERLTGTPHLGASTAQASEAIANEVVRIIEVFLKTGRPPGAVNLCQRSPATHHLVVRHFNRVGVLAGVLDRLREEDINVEEMENVIFDGAQAACCTLRLDGPPSGTFLNDLRNNSDVLHVLLEANP